MSAPPPAVPNKPGKVQVQVVRALYEYKASRDDELSFEEGDIIFLLLKQGEWYKARCGDKEGLVPANYVTDSSTPVDNPLHEAAKRGNIPFLAELLRVGLSVNALDHAAYTPLHWAARGGHSECVKMILAKNPVPNVQNKLGDTPLHCASWGGYAECVKLLLEKNYDKTIRNKEGKLAYDLSRDVECGALLADSNLTEADVDFDEDD